MFNLFDVIALAVMLLGGYFGLQTGILASTFYVASGFVGLWSARRFSATLGMNFYLLFALTAAIVIFAGFFCGRLFKKVFLGTPDRLIGGLLGLCVGWLIVTLALMPAFFHFAPQARKLAASSYTGSRILPYLENVLPGIRQFSVNEVTDVLPAVKLPDGVLKRFPAAKDGK